MIYVTIVVSVVRKKKHAIAPCSFAPRRFIPANLVQIPVEIGLPFAGNPSECHRRIAAGHQTWIGE